MYKRLVDEILLLDSRDGEVSVECLANEVGVSVKTIRADLKEMDRFLRKRNLGTIKVDAGNIKINCTIPKVVKTIGQMTFSEYVLSRDERLMVESLYLIFFGNRIKVQEMADFICISRSTVLLDLTELKEFLADYNLKLVGYSSIGSELEGKEEAIRHLFIHIFQKWNLLIKIFYQTLFLHSQMGAKFPFQQTIQECKRLIGENEKEMGIYLSDASFELILYYLDFAGYRIARGMELRDISETGEESVFSENLWKKMDASEHFAFGKTEKDFARYLLSKLYYVQGRMRNANLLKIQMLTRILIESVSKELGVDFYRDWILFESLTQHLERIFHAYKVESIMLADAEEGVLSVAREHLELLTCVENNISELQKYMVRKLSEVEIAYIVVYFCAARNRLALSERTSNVIIVCNGGVGTSQLIKSQIASQFQLNIKAVVVSHCLKYEDMSDVEFVISTTALEDCPVPYVTISPMLRDKDFTRIREMSMQFYHRNTVKTKELNCAAEEMQEKELFYLHELLSVDRILLDVEAKDWMDAIDKTSQPLLQEGYIEKEYIQDMIQCVVEHGPYIVIAKGFALPHASVNHVNQTGMSFARLKEPVCFGEEEMDPVNLICVLCPADSEKHLKALFDICNLLEEPAVRERMEACTSAEEAFCILNQLDY